MPNSMTSLAGAILLLLAAIPAIAEGDVDLDSGRAIFNEIAEPNCAICHSLAEAGAEGEIGPDLDMIDDLDIDRVRAAVTGGVGVMPAFNEVLSEEQIETVSAYVAAVAGKDAGATAASN
ncbi:cytochrome c [uncultured Jannaschia sp.]|uniref:c-type cytochrome n=1 Tax=uncultured Jannaschia sp. TaxID=293347 RepID=UPI0026182489|nr:cytochrome c [uncultured Jannaschia sp.]